MRWILAVALAAACGGARPRTAPPAVDAGATVDTATVTGQGGVGAICGYGERSGNQGKSAPPCAAGLTCCYPCGIQGCDSVCMAVTVCPAYP